MAGCKHAATGEDFYGPYDAQRLLEEHSAEIGIDIHEFEQQAYVPAVGGFVPASEVGDREVEQLSGTEFRRRLRDGETIPDWFAFPAVVDVLRAHQDKAAK